MVLSKEDKKLLKSWGYLTKDFKQIEEAINHSIFELRSDNNRIISATEARQLLGDQTFLSGIGRSAFHWTCSRENNGHIVDFDSKRIFR